MHTTPVEILSDASNAAVMRHPERRFPGVLVQGDTLDGLCVLAERACVALAPDHPALGEVEELREHLRALRDHYVRVLDQHGAPLPFGR